MKENTANHNRERGTMDEETTFYKEWRLMADRAVARAREFGQTYFMLSDGTLVLRSDYERWVRQNHETARRMREYQFQMEVKALHPKPWWIVGVLLLGFVSVVGFLFFY